MLWGTQRLFEEGRGGQGVQREARRRKKGGKNFGTVGERIAGERGHPVVDRWVGECGQEKL